MKRIKDGAHRIGKITPSTLIFNNPKSSILPGSAPDPINVT